MFERRKVLKVFVAGVTTAMVPAGIMAATLNQTESSGTSQSLRDQLTPLIGSRFRLTDSNGIAKRARLVAIDDGPRCAGLEQFSIVFEGADLTDGLHEVYHRQTGSSLIGLMPSDEAGAGMTRQRAHFSNFA